MSRHDITLVVRTTLAALARIAKRTRTRADDLLAAMLQANEGRLVDAVEILMGQTDQMPTEDQIVKALEGVGIHV